MISRKNILNDFVSLVAFDSESFKERQTVDWLLIRLRTLGFEVSEDDAGAAYGGDAGNIYGFLKGTLPGGPILFSAHMDVVQPGIGKKAVFDEKNRVISAGCADSSVVNKIVSAGDTVLGADDICGIVEILEGIRSVREAGIPHRDIEVLFTIGEELYGRGAAIFDYSKIRSKEAYVLDLSGAVGTAAVAAPSILSFEICIEGHAAHAGFEPERGRHAIQAMGDLAAHVKQGHIDSETTLNIGTISGGTAANIVPDLCICKGEIRSSNHERALQCVEMLNEELEMIKHRYGVNGTLKTEVLLYAYRTGENQPVVKHFQEACKELGLSGNLITTFGGSDNNLFELHGISGLVLSCGMYQVHSVREYTLVEDLEAGAKLAAQLIKT